MAEENPNDQQSEDLAEQSEEDQAEAEESGVEGEEADAEEGEEDGADDDDASGDGVQLISQKRYDELKKDPAALMDELNRAATKKFQDLSAAKRVLEPYADFITSYEEDPKTAVVELARSLGIKVDAPKTEAQAESVVEDLATKIHGRVKKALGEDYADLADKLSVAIQDAAEAIVDERLKPVAEGHNALARDAAQRTAEAITNRFTEEYPDWRKSEKAMQALSKKYHPAEGVDPYEYMRSLYILATNSKTTDSKVKKAVTKMAESARRASENKSRTVSGSTVSNDPGRPLTFKEAAAMADRGERLE